MPTSTFKLTNRTPLPTNADISVASQTEDGLEILQYPSDLLRDKVPVVGNTIDAVVPFISFYIMVPQKAQAIKDNLALDDDTSKNVIALRGLQYASEVNKELTIKAGEAFSTGLNDGKDRLRIQRKVQVLKKLICLHMPDTVNHDLSAEYSTLSIGKDLVKVGSVIDAVKHGIKMDMDKLGSDIVNFGAAFADESGLAGVAGTLAKYVQAGQGVAVNPLSEVFFENMQFRQFNFDFKMQPRNAAEAQEILDIIKTFRMYMVPEISSDNVAGIFFTVPGFFQIKYYIQDQDGVRENDRIPRISGCALTGVQTDWAPDGLSLHKDGMPNAVRIQLNFTELEIMHRDRIKDGY